MSFLICTFASHHFQIHVLLSTIFWNHLPRRKKKPQFHPMWSYHSSGLFVFIPVGWKTRRWAGTEGKKSPAAATTTGKTIWGSLHVRNGLACDSATPSALRVVFATVCLRLCVCLWLRRQSFQTGLSLTLVAHDRPPRCVFICMGACVCVACWLALCCVLSIHSRLSIYTPKTKIPCRVEELSVLFHRGNTQHWSRLAKHRRQKICPDEVKIEIKHLKTGHRDINCPLSFGLT